MLENKEEQELKVSSMQRVADRNSKKVFFRRRKGCPLHAVNEDEISYKNPLLLKKFTSEGGRILAARITGVCAKHQRKIRNQIKIARILAFLPFVAQFY